MRRALGLLRRLAALARAFVALAALGDSPGAAARILWVSAVLLARTRRRRASRRWFRLTLRFGGIHIPCVVSEYSDIVVLRECFVEDKYALPGEWRPATIVDLGANSGFSVLRFRVGHPQARIFAVEPDAHAFAKLRANTAGWPGIVIRRVAVGASDGRRPFYSSAESWTSSLVAPEDWAAPEEVGPVDPRSGEIDVRTLPSLLDELAVDRVDLLKVDVEGAEWELLDDIVATEGLAVVLGELHWDVGAAPDPARIEEILPGYDVSVQSSHGRRSTIVALRRSRDDGGSQAG